MSELTKIRPDLWQLTLPPLGIVNVFLPGDVLVDSGPPFAAKHILTALEGHEVSALALTHGHFDHQGSAHALCERLHIPLWCGEVERSAVQSGDLRQLLRNPGSRTARWVQCLSGPGHEVSRGMREGDLVGGFRVIHTPGHTPGHISFWRESDRVLVLGDVLFNRHPLTLRRGLREPLEIASADPSLNRETARNVAALEPSIICFGHGAPITRPEIFARFVSLLPGG